MKKKYYCIENCNNEISSWNFKYGKGRCHSCANRITSTKHGKYLKKHYCIDCKKDGVLTEITPGSKRCQLHSNIQIAKERKNLHKFDMNCNCFICKAIRKETNHKSDCQCCICKAKRGEMKREKCNLWKGGITSLRGYIKGLLEYKEWRNKVYEKDNFTCQECLKRGVKLNCHHIKPFSKILQEFLNHYPQFSPIEDKETLLRLTITWKDFWDVDNGITLCEKCHNLTKKGNTTLK